MEWLYGYRMVINVLVVDPHDHVSDWELWFAAAAQHQEGYCTTYC